MTPASAHLGPRPSSSASLRPSSSASAQRPSSSLSVRPRSSSSVSTSRPHSRPQSRVAWRPSSRHGHRARIQPLVRSLVAQITGFREEGTSNDPNGEKFKSIVDSVLKSLDSTALNKGAASVDIQTVDQQIHGHALKARINSCDALSNALQASYKKVKAFVAKNEDFDQEIKMHRLPDHLQLLVNLSHPPSAKTLAYAEELVHLLENPPAPPKPLTWADILAEEPFEGEHWEGVYGLPPGSVRGVSQQSADGWDSTPSLSPLESEIEFDDADSFPAIDSTEPMNFGMEDEVDAKSVQNNNKANPPYTSAHRLSLENMKIKQYWQENWQGDVDSTKELDLQDASTLGPALHRMLKNNRGDCTQHPLKYISECDIVREVIMALQGQQNLLYIWKNGAYTTTSSTPKLAHLSDESQNSILTSLATSASTTRNLRTFCSRVFTHSRLRTTDTGADRSASSVSRTIEAFADAVDSELRMFNQWCAEREEDVCRALGGVFSNSEPSQGLVVSLLNTEKAIRDRFGPSFDVLLEVIRGVTPELIDTAQSEKRGESVRTRTRPPSEVTAALMDMLFSLAQAHIERGEEADTFTGDVLMRVFVQTAGPVWNMVGDWLRDGMGFGFGAGGQDDGKLDDEFFIESSGLGLGMIGSGLLDPDFWKEGYSLREGIEWPAYKVVSQDNIGSAIPTFLEHVAELVLSAGKAVGLLRALGILPPPNDQERWMSFSSLLCSSDPYSDAGQMGKEEYARTEKLFAVSIDTLSRLIYDELAPRCNAAGEMLVKVLVDECDLWDHLLAIEDLYFMRRGDTMSHFTDLVFAKMDAQQSWGDFHFLNTAFSDVVTASVSAGRQIRWIKPSLVRFSYRTRGQSIETTVRALDGLSVDYAVPFPLAYIFQPRAIQVYCEIFVFLVQVRRAKSVLERILFRGETSSHELKPFYAMRGRLSWFINTLLGFLTTNVIHTEVLKFHEKFRSAKTLDDMIQLHERHIERVYIQCFLKSQAWNLHRAILAILDMSIHFNGIFTAFAGDMATHDVSKQSISMRRHRSRRLKRQRRNIIGFAQTLQEMVDTSSSSDDEEEMALDEPKNIPETSFSMASASVSMTEGNSILFLDKLSKELDELVRYIRRGVESLSSTTDEMSATFGVFAFALEDWDL